MASNYPNTERFIIRYANQVEQEIESRLHSAGKYATGVLYDSIRYEYKETGTKLILSFKMAAHGQYVDKGTKPSKYADMEGRGSGKSEFISQLMKWCQIKGLPKNAAFPIRRKIWKMGLPPTNFFTIPTTRRRKQFERDYKKNRAIDIQAQLDAEVKAANKKRKAK